MLESLVSSEGHGGRVCPGCSAWLVDDCVFPMSSHGLISLHICVLIFSYTDIGLGPIHVTSFYPNYLFIGFISKHSHILMYWRLVLQQINFGGNRVSLGPILYLLWNTFGP